MGLTQQHPRTKLEPSSHLSFCWLYALEKLKFEGSMMRLPMAQVKKSLHKVEFEFQKVQLSPKETLAQIE